MSDALDRLLARPAATTTVVIAADPDDAPQLEAATKLVAHADARVLMADDDQARAAAEQARRAAQRERDAVVGDIVTVTFSLAGIGPTNVEDLLRQHPPSDDAVRNALAAGRPRPQYDVDGFAPALLAATITSITYSDDPDHPAENLTVDQAKALWRSKLSTEDRERLFLAALRLDERGSSIEDLGKG